MANAIEYHIRGLKCDAAGCGYSDMDIKVEDYPKHLNTPCPKCGANLLTEADLKATQAMIAACDWFNSLGVLPGSDPKTTVRMHMDGSGIPKPEVIEP
jgi:hypothetical protein